MRNTLSVILSLLSVVALFIQSSIAEDLTQSNLPESAIARLGKGAIAEISYSPHGTRLAVAGGIGIWLYDAATGAEIALLTGHTRFATSVAFSPDERTLASGSGDTTIRLWNARTGVHLRTLEGHTNSVTSVTFSPDGSILASGSVDSSLR
ncbi:MAG: hypothetical protein OXN17_09770 [Candidatus Poribacteria bacterium]|nr:hypothetical protein [Candidatus Poribacteria bacterium]MDE0504759.1 hypothetical protein [Candidatus Poribacteria bacterium]